MTTASQEIDRVEAAVRAILAPAVRAARSTARASSAQSGATKPYEQVVDGRLLTARQVEAVGEHVRTLVLAPTTVVTPLAREALKKRGLSLRFVARGVVNDAGEWGFAIDAQEPAGALAALARRLLEDNWSEVEAPAEWVAAQANRGALVVTNAAARVVWEACAHGGTRAAQTRDVAELDRAVRTLGVNLVVIEADATPTALARAIADGFRKAGAPRPPADLENHQTEACSCESRK